MTIAFEPFPKIPRLNRGMIVTEKLDGTNAAIIITEDGREIGAQSRNRLITPEVDNYGFAGWVQRNADALITTLGPGRHFGEWWGAGIQRAYGLKGPDKRFSLFNVGRWNPEDIAESGVKGLGVVPVLYKGLFDNIAINRLVQDLSNFGSAAERGFMRPEGVVVMQMASRTMFKVTCTGDDAPKGPEGHAKDEQS